jgi:hypothetical protein
VVKLSPEQDFVAVQLVSLHAAGLPHVSTTDLDFSAISAVEADLKDEGFALLEDDFYSLDVSRKFSGFSCRVVATLARLPVT